MENFIRIYDRALSPEFCRDVIARFDKDERKFPGTMNAYHGNVVEKGKTTLELAIATTPGWTDVDGALRQSLMEHFPKYREDVKFLAGSEHKSIDVENLRVKKYPPGGSFEWHIDNSSPQTRERVLAAQWYFNTVAEGGRTEFEVQGEAIDAVEGRLVFFPVTWLHRHRGAPTISGPKYIATTFLHRAWN